MDKDSFFYVGEGYYEKVTKTLMSLPSMFSLKTFEKQICAVMETLVKAALTELSALVDKCSANAMAAHHRSSPSSVMPVKSEEEESKVTPLEFNKAMTVKHTHTK